MKLKIPRIVKAPKFRIRVKLPKAEIKNEYFAIAVLVVVFFSYAGIVYNMIRKPAPFSYQQPVYPSLSEQFVVEGYVAAIMLLFISLGIYLLYDAGKHIYSQSRMTRSLLLGLLFIGIGFGVIMWMLSIKAPSLFK